MKKLGGLLLRFNSSLECLREEDATSAGANILDAVRVACEPPLVNMYAWMML
jgi:hypothetical protein